MPLAVKALAAVVAAGDGVAARGHERPGQHSPEKHTNRIVILHFGECTADQWRSHFRREPPFKYVGVDELSARVELVAWCFSHPDNPFSHRKIDPLPATGKRLAQYRRKRTAAVGDAYTRWLAELDRLVAPAARRDLSIGYSFNAAYLEGLTPSQAVREAIAFLAAR